MNKTNTDTEWIFYSEIRLTVKQYITNSITSWKCYYFYFNYFIVLITCSTGNNVMTYAKFTCVQLKDLNDT